MTEETKKQIATIEAGKPLAAIIPSNLDEAWRLSMAVVKAGLVPKGYDKQRDEDTASAVMIGIMKGMEVGLSPITALSSIAVINNRPSIWGDGAVALVQKSGKLEFMKEWVTGTPFKSDWTAHCIMKRRDQSEPYERSFSYAQAEKAGLTKKPGPWMGYPERMLQVRARAFCIRDGFADVLCGLSIAEEVNDMPVINQEKVDTSFLEDDVNTEPQTVIDVLDALPEVTEAPQKEIKEQTEQEKWEAYCKTSKAKIDAMTAQDQLDEWLADNNEKRQELARFNGKTAGWLAKLIDAKKASFAD